MLTSTIITLVVKREHMMKFTYFLQFKVITNMKTPCHAHKYKIMQ